MKNDNISNLLNSFESHAHSTDEGVEFWLARDLQNLLGYTEWRNFTTTVNKAKLACETNGNVINSHFVDANKIVETWIWSPRSVKDIMLTRYACYLVAQNGDSRKEQVAFAMQYFATQTRKAEIIEQRMLEYERVQARDKLKETEKELSQVIFEQTGKDQNFALIRSKGDTALFWKTTQQMKITWWIDKKKPLADFMPTILLKAKDFATEITIHNAKENHMDTESQISSEHVTNNTSVRDTLLSRGITPEKLSPEDDVNKLRRKLSSDTKKWLSDPDTLPS